jgi:hypothetical protein
MCGANERPIQITVAAPDPIRSRSPTACLALASHDFVASVIRKDQISAGLAEHIDSLPP